ncbi:MAG TPA: threonine ammonia-lyase [Acidimicrobiales bacterium]|nr:threonine ammonia-lyase [Acidimicrobiales bacterium]
MSIEEVREAEARIAGVVRRTPLSRFDSLVRAAGADVWCKEEQRQRTGSFKIRGAYNHIAQLEPGTHVVAASAGNHAQGVALAASLCRLTSTIFMPRGASLPKVTATQEYGAVVELVGDSIDDAVRHAKRFARDNHARFVPPFDDRAVIAGQGTIALEVLSELPEVATIVVPIGGGGLISGIAAAIKALAPKCRIVGVEAEGAASMRASLDAGVPRRLQSVVTIADGIAVKAPSALTVAHVEAFVDDVVTVSDEEIGQALVTVLERMKSIVEPSGAAGLAAVMANKFPRQRRSGPTVVLLSGGNVDALLLSRLIEHGLSVAGRYLRLRIDVPDRPGSLARLASDIAQLELNILAVDHHRERASLDLDEVEVAVTVETRGQDHRRTALRALRDRGWHVRPS